MRVLLVDGYDQTDPDCSVVSQVTKTLLNADHVVTRIAVRTEGFSSPMSEAERRCYHDEGSNMLVEDVVLAARQVQETEALLFCYPSSMFTVPAALKNWFDRVLLPGVAFTIDAEGTLRSRLKYINRLGVITT
ncbi:MAG: NAD(P)H-dependent oxidoreductase, partial [Acidimicrobiales bacterium]